MNQLYYEVKLRLAGVLRSVEFENDYQIGKWGIQDHPLWRWMLILTEECGEAVDAYLRDTLEVPDEEYYLLAEFVDLGSRAKALLEGDLPDRTNAKTHAPDLGKEIIQIAAVCVAMEECRRRQENGNRRIGS